MTKTTFVPSPNSTYTKEQKDWLRAAYRTMLRLLKKNASFHAPEFWEVSTKGDYPWSTTDFRGNRAIGDVYKQLIADGHMTDSNPGWAKRVGKTGTFKPVYRSNLHTTKVGA